MNPSGSLYFGGGQRALMQSSEYPSGREPENHIAQGRVD